MLKLGTLILGEDYKILKSSTPESRKKVAILGPSILIPVILWFIQGFLATYLILEKGLWISLVAGVTTSTLIFFLDKSIIAAPGNGWVNLSRLVLGIPIAIIGSLIIDEILLENDIDNHMSVYIDRQVQKNRDETLINNSENLDVLKNDVIVAETAWKSKLKEAAKEADGSSGSGHVGYGDIAKLKVRQANALKNDYQFVKLKYDNELKILEAKMEKSEDQYRSGINENSILTKILVLWDLVNDSRIGQIIYGLLFTVLLGLELLPIMIKIIWKKKTGYEIYKDYLERIAFNRIQKLGDRDERVFNPALSSIDRSEIYRKSRIGKNNYLHFN